MKNHFVLRAKRLVALLAVVAVGAIIPACVSTNDSESAESIEEPAAVSSEAPPTNNDVIAQALAGSEGGTAEAAKPAVEAAPQQTDSPAVDVAANETPANAAAQVPPVENGASAGSASANEADPFAPVANNNQQSAPEVAAQPAEPLAPAMPMSAPVADETVPGVEQQTQVAVASALPENGTLIPYVVKRGDTLASIAKKIFGKSDRWKDLAKENNIHNPNLIYSGDVVLFSLDAQAKSFAEKHSSTAKKIVKVVTGDSLWSIASRELGEGSAWRVLVKNNPKITDPNRIFVGMNIVVPTGAYVAVK